MNNELRIPNKLILNALQENTVKQVRVLCYAKMVGLHRCKLDEIGTALKLKPRTLKRTINSILQHGWATSDGEFLFPKSWRRLKLSKKGGLYLAEDLIKNKDKFEALCFAKGLKNVYRKQGGQRPSKGRTEKKDLPARYLSKSLGLSDWKFKQLKRLAQKYRFIRVSPQRFNVIGKAAEAQAYKKHLPGLPVFSTRKLAVIPEISTINVLI